MACVGRHEVVVEVVGGAVERSLSEVVLSPHQESEVPWGLWLFAALMVVLLAVGD